MKFKRSGIVFLALTLILSMALSVFLVSCGGSTKGTADNKQTNQNTDGKILNSNESGPLTDKPITLRAFAARAALHAPFAEMPVVLEYEKETNVHIEWIETPDSGARDSINLMFASNDLPDFFAGNLTDGDILKYADTSLTAIDKYLDSSAPNLKKIFGKNPDFRKFALHPNGHLYSFPVSTGLYGNLCPDNMYINKKWLDTLGLKVPQTTDEFYQVLRAFKDKDPNGNGKADEVPLSFMFSSKLAAYNMMGPFGVVAGNENVMVENDKVIFVPTQPGYQEAIQYYAKLYSEGLLDKDTFTMKQNGYFQKGKSPDCLIGVGLGYLDEEVFGPDRAYNDYICLLPLKGPKGFQLWNNNDNNVRRTGNGVTAISTANKYPEITVRWMDRFYTEKWSVQTQWGHLGTVIKQDANGKYSAVNPPEGMTAETFRFQSTPAMKLPYYFEPDFFANKYQLTKDQARKEERSREYAKYFPKQIMPKAFYTEEQSQERDALFTDINNYVLQMQKKWITEGNVQAEWDEYKKNLENMGLSKLMKLYQEKYDSYKNMK